MFHALRGLALTAALTLSPWLVPGAHAGEAEPPVWERIDNPAPTVGLDGKPHRAQCSGFPGTDPSFRFWARKGASKNLVIYFEGGGACWDNLTCTFPVANLPPEVPQFFFPQVPPNTDPASLGGLFRGDRADNPVADWDMVYIPYCTGDLHTGSATREYTSVGNAALGVAPGAPLTIEHRGFDNFMVVLEWARKNFDKPKNVLVTGVSAGGYGATSNSPWVGRAYPQAKLFVMADSSQGVTTSNFDIGIPGRQSWNPQLAPWVFGSDVTAVSGRELMRRAAAGQSKARFAQFTTSFDNEQIAFYGLMKQNYGPGGACPNPAVDWYQQMSQQLLADAADLGNYRYYVAGGQYHMLLFRDNFYDESSAGVSFASWLGEMLKRGGGSNGAQGAAAQWSNLACPTCLINLPCQ